jgi:hypothetical protein
LSGTVARLNARLYCGRFSRDGSTFAVSRQDDRLVVVVVVVVLEEEEEEVVMEVVVEAKLLVF